jgi:hypothetical protein
MHEMRIGRYFLGTLVLGMLLALALPATALGQGRGRGHGRNNIGIGGHRSRQSLYDRKCAKFRNCHDASEGRWDGRGPNGSRVGNILGTRRRHRNRDWNDDLIIRNRANRDYRNDLSRGRGRRKH